MSVAAVGVLVFLFVQEADLSTFARHMLPAGAALLFALGRRRPVAVVWLALGGVLVASLGDLLSTSARCCGSTGRSASGTGRAGRS